MKKLNEASRKYADVELPYDRRGFSMGTEVSGQTIHPDGTVIPFRGQTLRQSTGRGRNIRTHVKAFTLPDFSRTHSGFPLQPALRRQASRPPGMDRAGRSLSKESHLQVHSLSRAAETCTSPCRMDRSPKRFLEHISFLRNTNLKNTVYRRPSSPTVGGYWVDLDLADLPASWKNH